MTYYSESSLFRKVINFIEPILKEMKMRASKKIENVQLVLPPPKRPDTYISKFARWPQPLGPQPLGILSVGTYIKQNNPGVEVEILDGNNVLTQ
jgi:hypothetical protein